MNDLKMRRLAVAMLSFIPSKEETHANCIRSKKLTRRRLLEQESNLWPVTLTRPDVKMATCLYK